MEKFRPEFATLEYIKSMRSQPDFNNIIKLLKGEKPDRFTLFEFFLNEPLYRRITGNENTEMDYGLDYLRMRMEAYFCVGYDYVTIPGSDFKFPSNKVHIKKSISLNEGGCITDRKSYNEYPWPNPDEYDYSRLKTLADELPEGMKLIVWGPGGVFENVIKLVGYDKLCYMLVDDPGLVQDLFDAVGSRMVRHYEISGQYDSVGALMANDDWGFNTQTLMSVPDMRKYVIPWHKRIVETIHKSGKPAILHSCGNLESVMEDIISDIKYEAKHSYEDNIIPIEDAYDKWNKEITLFGGIDVDFICRSTPEEVYNRSVAMLEKTKDSGRYALGSGNSIPEYVPDECYFAMIAAALANRKMN